MRNTIISTIHINQPEFIESLMNGVFKGRKREYVIEAVTSNQPSPENTYMRYDGEMKITYELMLDQVLKTERQKQIRHSQLQSIDEPLFITRKSD